MCTTCGCDQEVFKISRQTYSADPHDRHHDHHNHGQGGHSHPLLDVEISDPPLQSLERSRRTIQLEQDLLSKNQKFAEKNRQYLSKIRVPALNLVSSPGAGKTTLLTRTIRDLKDSASIAVIEGDQQTSHDAAQIAGAGAQAIQINTGKGCHLDARMVGCDRDALCRRY